MMKRNFGSFLRAKTHHGRMRDMMMKVLTHNLAVALVWVFYRALPTPLDNPDHAPSPMVSSHRRSDFSDTMMFVPPGTDTIAVPLKSLRWHFSAGAYVNAAGKWMLDPTFPLYITPAENGAKTNRFPVHPTKA